MHIKNVFVVSIKGYETAVKCIGFIRVFVTPIINLQEMELYFIETGTACYDNIFTKHRQDSQRTRSTFQH